MPTEEDLQQDSDGAQQPKQQTLDGDTAEIDYKESSSSQGAKVRRIIRKYNLDGLGQELKQKYTGPGRRWSLRELEEEFNLEVLDHSTRGAQVKEEEYHDCIQRLKSNDRELTQERLRLLGVDGKEVLNDMVTYETIRLYLKNFHGATAQERFVSPSKSAETVELLHHRLRRVLSDILERHHRRDEVPAEPEIDSTVGVVCPDCGATVSAVKYLQLQTCPNCL